MRFRMMLPEPGEVEIAELMATLRLDHEALDERPYTVVNFVASADGRATFAGRSGQLGDDGDRTMFHALREGVDAVLVGTGTLRTERYGRLIRGADARARREARGLAAEPLVCVVTRSGEIPAEIPLFAEPGAAIIVFSMNEVSIEGCAASVELVRLDPGAMTLVTVMRHLRTKHQIRSLLCEGGPTLFGALLGESLVDELFLTIAPKLTGGGRGPTVTSGPELPELAPLDLKWALEREGALYMRYGLSNEQV